MASSRFVIGIDLGTTNCALAYLDTGAGNPSRSETLVAPQVVQPGVVEGRTLLPSFLYLPNPNEQPAGALKLPWDANRDYAVGEFARSSERRSHPARLLREVLALPSGSRPQGPNPSLERPGRYPQDLPA